MQGQLQGSFSTNVPVDNLCPHVTLIHELNNYPLQLNLLQFPLILIVYELKLAFQNIKTKMAVIYKSKHLVAKTEISLVDVVHEKNYLIINDIFDSKTTLRNAAGIFKRESTKSVMAYAIHPFIRKSYPCFRNSNLSNIYNQYMIQNYLDKFYKQS